MCLLCDNSVFAFLLLHWLLSPLTHCSYPQSQMYATKIFLKIEPGIQTPFIDNQVMETFVWR